MEGIKRISAKVIKPLQILFMFHIVFLLTTCLDNINNQRDTTIYLELLNTWVTSATLQVSVEDTTDNWSFTLARDDSIIIERTITRKDTIILDTGLEPGMDYNYIAYWLNKGKIRDSSNVIAVTTMDTTSHAFTWEALAGGTTLGSSFHDVEIIAPDDIWVVGEIETDEMDSNNLPIRYNAAHFDGREWVLKKLTVRWDGFNDDAYFITMDSSGQDLTCVMQIEDELWFMGQGSRIRLINDVWDYFPENQYWSYYHNAYRVWAASRNAVFISGWLGDIIYYDGNTFFRKDLGTDIPLSDIWGLDENHVWAVGWDRGDGSSVIYFYDGISWNEKYYFNLDQWDGIIDADTLDGQVASVWAYGDTVYFCCSTGIWKESISTGEGKLVPSSVISEDGYYIYKGIRGNNYNDIMVVGSNDHRVHFNGKNWFKCGGIYNRATLEALDVQGDNFVIVGHTKELQGLIIQGNR